MDVESLRQETKAGIDALRREPPVRTVYAAGVISGVAWWNEGYDTPAPSTVSGVTLNADAEDFERESVATLS